MYLCTVEENKKIILFDGVCNLCNGAVQFVIKRDKKDAFRYAALQSEIGEKLLKERSIDTKVVDSIILIEPGKAYYTKSDAALEIGRSFGGGYALLAIFTWIPKSIRDAIYDFVARNRYKWFGKEESCMIPTPELKAKFLG
ncbi:thiol-disulfide oxidoreductase DCC family protein [Flagellimonas alvinocaridis]|uniref:Thiol-disulfide oxidoreductase DCC family protein n=1 Tax=Flagellimonas alvinocaridis TaxID=2530200 RepID=A0A4S8RK16_9FLAO|nr:thiol-disulfide oxidoreductase DCC family protein [Allomuricauda alvinocaridis]THV58330.1 thiol-disulfide oxidoreductase DCC family protein [Allomuricauda alvinocaridis]